MSESPETGSAVTRKERMIALFAAAVIGGLMVQPALVQRQADRQVEFAWEMYSKSGPRDEIDLVFDDRVVRTSPAELQKPAPVYVDYLEILPEFLCQTMPELRSVRTYQADSLLADVQCP